MGSRNAFFRAAVFAVSALLLGGGIGSRARADEPPLRGFLAADVAAERQAEQTVLASPSEAAALLHETALASQVHRMGTPGDYRTALYVRDALQKAGWTADLVTYTVPIAVPVEQRLQLLEPSVHDLDLREAAIPGDRFSYDHRAIGIPYSGYSNDGDVTGPLVYANYARPEDFATLAKLGVDVHGAIIVARIGKGSLTAKAFESAKHGAAATLIFADPMDGGYFKGDPYPQGPWRPLSASLRNTMTFTNDPGDPTAIGVPVPGAPHKPFSTIVLPSIPEMPITGDVAQQLMGAMGGQVAPDSWHGGFPVPLHLGGTARARFVLHSKRSFGPIWDVIATLPGSDPSRMVVVGGHRDAWTYGAVDPISGTVDLIQLAEAYGKAARSGWKPRHTIVIGSWDGEELNLFGSDIWVEQHDAELRAGMIAYVNTDEVAFGPQFGIYATPELAPLARAAAADATAPDGSSLDAYWSGRDPKRTIEPVGGGSDHEPFVYHENLPALGAGFGGPFGTYHSAYDDLDSLKVFDPGMHRAAAAARYTSLVTMRLADAAAPNIQLTPLADALRERLKSFSLIDTSPRRREVVRGLLPALQTFEQRAQTLDTKVDEAVASGDAAKAGQAFNAVRTAEAAFYLPAGIDGRWSRSLLYGLSEDAPYLPTLESTLDPVRGKDALATLLAAFARAGT